jgi:hypothetical protein
VNFPISSTFNNVKMKPYFISIFVMFFTDVLRMRIHFYLLPFFAKHQELFLIASREERL